MCGAKDASRGLLLQALPRSNLTFISPSKSLNIAEVPIFIGGQNFFKSASLKCKFGHKEVPATFVSSMTIVCVSPVNVEGYYPIEIANNGRDYTQDGLAYQYEQCPEGYYCPDQDSIKCPRGAFCPGVGNFNFTQCPPGTWQNSTGQANCRECPVGYVCPVFGMEMPLVCPAGAVCDAVGNVFGEKPCPGGYYCHAGTKTMDPTDTLIEDRPKPCADGYYCLPGVATNQTEAGNYLTPQKCAEGHLCTGSSSMPSGDGPCPTGYYCPAAEIFPCPNGTFCPGTGNIEPVDCLPGNYTDRLAQSACFLCPIGFYCPTPRTIVPTICEAGDVCEKLGGAGRSSACKPGYYCLSGTNTSDHNAWHETNKPYPCAEGTYCVNAVRTTVSVAGDMGTPQSCSAGAWCSLASKTPLGSGPCPNEFYCPLGSPYPTETPPGYFTDRKGLDSATVCRPGGFTPNSRASSCIPCPSGFECGTNAVTEPLRCAAGYYRSQLDGVDCEKCPPGTWSPNAGNTNVTGCQPCEEGRACTISGLSKIERADLCPPGHFCPLGTSQQTQEDHKCPKGFFCGFGTKPSEQRDKKCPPGFYCFQGTKLGEEKRYQCDPGFYCPESTPGNGGQKMANREDCAWIREDKCQGHDKEWFETFKTGQQSEFCNNFLYCQATEGGNLESAKAKAYVCPQGIRCPRGTTSEPGSFHLDNCTSDAAYRNKCGPINWVYPLEDPNWLEGQIPPSRPKPDTAPTFPAQALSVLTLTFDFSRLPKAYEDFTYGEQHHYLIRIIPKTDSEEAVGHEETKTNGVQLPMWFTRDPDDEGPLKPASQNLPRIYKFQVMVREAITLVVRIDILHGKFDNDDVRGALANSLKIEVDTPKRAELGKEGGFVAFITNYEELESPQNFPPKLGALLNDDNPFRDSSIVINFVDENILEDRANTVVYGNPVRENAEDTTFEITPETFWSETADEAFPFWHLQYFPFFSNCYGFDSHIPIFEVLEDATGGFCDLKSQMETSPIDPWSPWVPDAISDKCSRPIECTFEDNVHLASRNPRWFEIVEPETELFWMSEEGVGPNNFEEGHTFFKGRGVGKMIPVVVDSESVIPNKIPGEVNLKLSYYQVNPTLKRLVTAELSFGAPPTWRVPADPIPGQGPPPEAYILNIEFEPLSYFDLVNTFSFGYGLFMILFCGVGILSMFAVNVFWVLHRIFTRLKHPPKLRLISYIRLNLPMALTGVALSSAPMILFVGGIRLILQEGDPDKPQDNPGAMDKYPGEYDTQLEKLTDDDIANFRTGRYGFCFMIAASYIFIVGSALFCPRPPWTSKNSNSIEDNAHRWKRSHMIIATLGILFLNVFVVEFSYAEAFGADVLTWLLLFKLVGMLIEELLEGFLDDLLLAYPLVISIALVEFLILLGADDFIDFVTSHFIELLLLTVERMYVPPTQKAISGYVKKHYARLVVRIKEGTWEPLETAEELKRKQMKKEFDVTVVDLIKFLFSYSQEAVALNFGPVLVWFTYIFHKELNYGELYGIKKEDLIFYILFSVVMIFFQTVIDMTILHAQELFRGWRIYDYLYFAKAKFEHRDHRWRGSEYHNIDPNVEHVVQHIDLLCFSSQYYFMGMLYCEGILLLIFAVEFLLRAKFNFFADPMMVPLFLYTLGLCFVIHKVLFFLAVKGGLWDIPKEKKMAVAQMDNKFDGVVGNQYTMGADRVTSEAFKHKFLETNRAWILQNFSTLFTPDFIRENQQWFQHYFGGILPGIGGAPMDYDLEDETRNFLGYDFTDTEDEDDDFPFLPVDDVTKTVATLWLSHARQRLQMKNVAERVFASKMGPCCDICESTEFLQVLPRTEVNQLCKRFEEEHDNEVDFYMWELYCHDTVDCWTLCPPCFEEERRRLAFDVSGSSDDDTETDDFETPELPDQEKSLLRGWVQIARKRMKMREIMMDIVTWAQRSKCEKCTSKKNLQVSLSTSLEESMDEYEDLHWGQKLDEDEFTRFFRGSQEIKTLCGTCLANIHNQPDGAPDIFDESDSDSGSSDGGQPEWTHAPVSESTRRIAMKWLRKTRARIYGRPSQMSLDGLALELLDANR
eukprot:GFYU01001597.1.p1 GENE.GFYU01001597.1~~GFYU01001597.1.p1  ORF type:complete len:2276 (-),score=442.42 GFYU01001597.1:56-6250(-)